MNLKIKFLLYAAMLMCIARVSAQPTIQWLKNYGTALWENACFGKSIKTADGGLLMAGSTGGQMGTVDTYHSDVIVIKTDSAGNLQWQKTFGGSLTEFATDVIQTQSGDYLVTGVTESNDGDVAGNHSLSPHFDGWLLKLDPLGNILWQQCYGGNLDEMFYALLEKPDGSYLLSGIATSNNSGDVGPTHQAAIPPATQYPDVWVLNVDVNGAILWSKCYGGTSYDGVFYGVFSCSNCSPPATQLESLLLTTSFNFYHNNMSMGLLPTGEMYVYSASSSLNGDVSAPRGGKDVWILKLDSLGNLIWEKSFGSTANNDYLLDARATQDYGSVFFAWGNTSTDFNAIQPCSTGRNIIAVKIDSSGNITWVNAFGNTLGSDYASRAVQDANGDYYVVGTSRGNDHDLTFNQGLNDAWMFKLSSSGSLLWQKSIGGMHNERGLNIHLNADSTLYVTGSTFSSASGDVTGANHGMSDYFIAKFSKLPRYEIRGAVFNDLNQNCVKDANEAGIRNKVIKCQPGNYLTTTDANGNYTLFVDSGTYVVSHLPPALLGQFCPAGNASYTATVNAANPYALNNDFADTLSPCADLKADINTWILRRCRRNNYSVTYTNLGVLTAVDVNFTVNLDPATILLSSSLPYTVQGGQYIFHLDSVLAGQTGMFTITDSVDCTIPPGTTLCAWVNASTLTTDCFPDNNSDTSCIHVIGSYDPNSKETESVDPAAPGYVAQQNISSSDRLSYLIRFQNVGNDTAFKVVVRDTVSPLLDLATIQLGASSHPYQFRIYGNGICEWTFYNINLTDSLTNELESHGFVEFSVAQSPGNGPGTVINNTAHIWFDYNDPISTNNAENTIPVPVGVEQVNPGLQLLVYPNPAHHAVNFSLGGKVPAENLRLRLYDLMGKKLMERNFSSSELMLNTEKLAPGLYSYQLGNGAGIYYTGKLVIE